MDTNAIFKWCVELLKFYAQKFGTTYEAIKVWIFFIIEPIVFILMVFVIFKQAKRIRQLKQMEMIK